MGKRTKKETRERMLELFRIMLDGGTVLIKDVDGVVKASRITAIYDDRTLTLPDVIYSDRGIWEVTISRAKETS